MKLGVINVLNVLPVYYGILSGQVPFSGEIVADKVTELNRKLCRGLIDVSVISSFEYALNPSLYYVFPELSVSSNGPVRSIFLFSERPWEKIQNVTILLTEFSLTSVHLIQYLLKDRNVSYTRDKNIPHCGELLIADEAIQRFYSKRDAFSYDLGELWKKQTGLPFVFAVWAVRRDSLQRNPEQVRQVWRNLIRSKKIAVNNYPKMAGKYFQGVFPDAELCESYLTNLQYDLSPIYQEGFLRFQEEMKKLKKLQSVHPIQFLPFSTEFETNLS